MPLLREDIWSLYLVECGINTENFNSAEDTTTGGKVKLVWQDLLSKDRPLCKERVSILNNFLLPVGSVQMEPFWKDHLPRRTDEQTDR